MTCQKSAGWSEPFSDSAKMPTARYFGKHATAKHDCASRSRLYLQMHFNDWMWINYLFNLFCQILIKPLPVFSHFWSFMKVVFKPIYLRFFNQLWTREVTDSSFAPIGAHIIIALKVIPRAPSHLRCYYYVSRITETNFRSNVVLNGGQQSLTASVEKWFLPLPPEAAGHTGKQAHQ